MNGLTQDIRFGLRTLWNRPGFAAVATLTLTLGTGATTAIFSIVDAVLVRPMPYLSPERLVVVWEANHQRGIPFMNVAPPNLEDWRARSRSFDALAVWRPQSFTAGLESGAEQLQGAAVSHEMFRTLGVQPSQGRAFTEAEDRSGGAAVALLSDGMWRRLFAGDPAAVGRTITIDGVSREIVGVMPAGFNFPPPIDFEGVPSPKANDVWVPIGLRNTTGQRGAHYLLALGRLRDGVTLAAAERELAGVAAQIARENPETNTGWTTRLVPLGVQVTGDQRPALLALSVAVGLVLLLACTNVASLLLARGSGRRREMAVRQALGASRTRLARQVFTESVVLAAAGSVLGIVLAAWIVRVVRTMGGPLLPRLDEVAVDGRALLFAAAACITSAVIFGMAPALHFARGGSAEWLKDRSGHGRTGLLQPALVVVELALSMVLLAGAALVGESFLRLVTTDPGFRADQTVMAHVSLPQARYPNRVARVTFIERLMGSLPSEPGILAVAATDAAPLSDDRQGTGFSIDGEPSSEEVDAANVNFSFVTPGYFGALGIPVIRGRDFTEADRQDSAPVIIINDAFARRYFQGRDPVGRRIRAGFNTQTPREIIAVVGNERHVALDREAPATMYTAFAQVSWGQQVALVVRTSLDAAAAAAALRGVVQSVDPQVPVYDVRSMGSVIRASVSRPRFSAVLLGGFAAVALLLAGVGIYGVIAQLVGQRTQEFGVRLALGAAPRDLARLVLGFGFRLAVAGAAIGLPLALLFSRALGGLLYQVSPMNPITYAGVAAVLLAVAAAAALVPARRAVLVDPAVALRAE